MALLKYFKRVDAKTAMKNDIVLPKPDGPLSSVIPSLSIESANVAVKKAMLVASHVTAEGDEIDDYKRCGTYQHFTSKEKLELGKRAAELGISSTVCYFTAIKMKLLTMYTASNIFIAKYDVHRTTELKQNASVPGSTCKLPAINK